MAYKIIISQTAEESYFDNLDFLFKHWTLKEIEHFIEKSEHVKRILEKNAFAFRVWKHDETILMVPIVEQVTLFYSVYNNFVELLLFWNNFQDPKKLFDLLNH
ncbi:hypothetical protein O4H26_01875 [Aequorivita viscosa]|nr:hypothetical protein [Aequorivita viscosa]